jgi:hypothetical protein
MIEITLLAGIQVLRFSIVAASRTEAIKKAVNEAVCMGYTKISIIG